MGKGLGHLTIETVPAHLAAGGRWPSAAGQIPELVALPEKALEAAGPVGLLVAVPPSLAAAGARSPAWKVLLVPPGRETSPSTAATFAALSAVVVAVPVTAGWDLPALSSSSPS